VRPRRCRVPGDRQRYHSTFHFAQIRGRLLILIAIVCHRMPDLKKPRNPKMADRVQEKIPFLPQDEPFETHADLTAVSRLRRPSWLFRAVLLLLFLTCLISNTIWWASYRTLLRKPCTRPQLVFCTSNSQAAQTRLMKFTKVSKLPQLKLSLTRDGPCGDRSSRGTPTLAILAMTRRQHTMLSGANLLSVCFTSFI
jgi:hypothetical protein